MADALTIFKTKQEVLNKAIEKKEYFVGSQLSLADLVIFAGVYWPFSFATSEKDRKPYPHLMKWYLRMGAEHWFLAWGGRLRVATKPFPVQ
jgi:glutathione S-transferase